MESMYEPGRSAIPSWRDGIPPERAEHKENKVNQLVLPDGRRP
jgi:hypothetical protein